MMSDSLRLLFSPMKIVAANCKDEAIRMRSSSGGAFYYFAMSVIGRGGIVIGAAYAENGTDVVHVAVNDGDGLARIMKSKYAPSSLAGIDLCKIVKEAGDKPVLFSGTPCQIKSMLNKFGNNRPDNLLLIEVACHGLPPVAAYKKYIQNNQIAKIDFRCKRKGWKNSEIFIEHTDGTVEYQSCKDNTYYREFIENSSALRRACMSCRSKCFRSGADITLADHWGVHEFSADLYDNRGTSLIFLNTSRAKEYWQTIESHFLSRSVNLFEAIYWNPSIVRMETAPKLVVEKFASVYVCLRGYYEALKNRIITT